MRFFKPAAAVIITLSLILNLVLLQKVSTLEDRIASLLNNYSRVESLLHSYSGQMNNTLTQMKKDQSWVTPARIEIDPSSLGREEVGVKLGWQVKEYQEGSQVTAFYRTAGEAEFKTVKAQAVGGGYFEVNIPFKVKAEPQWNVHIQSRSGSGKNMTPPAIAEKIAESVLSLEYYISVSHGANVRSSEVETANLDKLAYGTYNPLMTNLFIVNDGSQRFEIDLFEPHSLGGKRASLERALLKVYNGSVLLLEKPLEARQEPAGPGVRYNTAYESGEAGFTRLTLQVKYNNGREFVKDIYTK